MAPSIKESLGQGRDEKKSLSRAVRALKKGKLDAVLAYGGAGRIIRDLVKRKQYKKALSAARVANETGWRKSSILRKRAKLEARFKNWSKVYAVLGVLESRKVLHRREYYVVLYSEAALRLGLIAAADEVLWEALNRGAVSSQLVEAYVYLAIRTNRPLEAARRAELYLDDAGRNLSPGFYSKLASVYKQLNRRSEAGDILSRCADGLDALADRSRTALLQGRYTEALARFKYFVSQWAPSSETSTAWEEAFEAVVALFRLARGEAVNSVDAAFVYDDESGFREHRVEKVFVSGMGWSGSGAVVDCLSDVEGVNKVNIGEFKHIEGQGCSLQSLRRASDQNKWLDTLASFFFYTLLGYGVPNAVPQLKAKVRGRRISMQSQYAAGCHAGIKAFLRKQNDHVVPDREAYMALYENVINAIVACYTGNGARVVLIDNAIHLRSVEDLAYVKDSVMYAVVRDPRDNYISRKYENKKTVDVEKFISRYRKQRQEFSDEVDRLIECGCNIRVIQFEEFVLNERLRNTLISALGLNPDNVRERRRFNPRSSQGNIGLYQGYANTSEIRQIEKELSEYLWGGSEG